MSDSTRIEKLREEVEKLCGNCDRPDKEELGKIILSSMALGFSEGLKVSSTDRSRGEWIVRFPYEDTGKTRTCSNCNITQTVNVYDGVVRFKFCPYCGAIMKGADDE